MLLDQLSNKDHINERCRGMITKTCHFLVTLFLIPTLLAFDILPASEYTDIRTFVSIENLGLSEILQVSKEYVPASLSFALLASKSRHQIPSLDGRLLLEFPPPAHQPVGHFLLKVFLLPPTVLELVSATVLRC
jgi:hypothetical protein